MKPSMHDFLMTDAIHAALIAAAYLALYNSSVRASTAWAIPVIIIGKVYSNAMMVNFNHRIQFLGGRNDTQNMPSSFLSSDKSVVTNDEIQFKGEH
jgi:hypothetical protein